VSKRPSAFTLIELLVVMAIIIILASLVLGISGYVQKKGARSRAEAEIAAMSAACESYKADNGTYPTDATYTAQVNPTSSPVPATASKYLYGELSGDPDGDRSLNAGAKSYFSFKPNMLFPAPPATTAVTGIRDPFGNVYGYSTAKATNPTGTAGYNPTFDLWSTAGTAGTSALDQNQWIKNW
jgi:prepilin-type N-terminal cleavage/methylation domain-containing protein